MAFSWNKTERTFSNNGVICKYHHIVTYNYFADFFLNTNLFSPSRQSFCKPLLDVLDENHERLLRIRGPYCPCQTCCCTEDVDFNVSAFVLFFTIFATYVISRCKIKNKKTRKSVTLLLVSSNASAMKKSKAFTIPPMNYSIYREKINMSYYEKF